MVSLPRNALPTFGWFLAGGSNFAEGSSILLQQCAPSPAPYQQANIHIVPAVLRPGYLWAQPFEYDAKSGVPMPRGSLQFLGPRNCVVPEQVYQVPGARAYPFPCPDQQYLHHHGNAPHHSEKLCERRFLPPGGQEQQRHQEPVLKV